MTLDAYKKRGSDLANNIPPDAGPFENLFIAKKSTKNGCEY